MKKPLFIVVDGPDGSGKTTVIEMLSALLKERDISHVKTKALGGEPIGMAIRERMLSGDKLPVCVTPLMALTATAMTYLEVVSPALFKGDVVICDRGFGSYLAYQVYGDDITKKEKKFRKELMTNVLNKLPPALTPDLYIYCMAPSDVRENRLKDRSETNHYDLANKGFKERVDKGYNDYFNSNPSKHNCLLSTNKLRESIISTLDDLLDNIIGYYK